MKCPTEPDLLPLLPPDGLPLLPPDFSLLSSVRGGRRRVVSWGWEVKGQWWRKRGSSARKREGKSEREAESTEG